MHSRIPEPARCDHFLRSAARSHPAARDRQFPEVAGRAASKNKIEIATTDAARTWIYQKGYDPAYGARTYERTIDEHVKKPLVDEILFEKLEKGGHVTVDSDGTALTFVYSFAPPAKKLKKKETPVR